MLSKIEEMKLIAKCVLGDDRRAFGTLVEEYQPAIRRFLLTLTVGDDSLCDDLAQETFIKAYTNIRAFKGLSKFSTWLYRIAYNVYYDYTRSHRPTADIDSPTVRTTGSPTVDSNLKLDLYDALQLLTPPERTCVTLQLMEGQAIDKIAEITDMPLNTVKSHLSRGKKKMADFLRANGYR